MKIKPIHPFPARMAPDLAVSSLGELTHKSTVLDPMNGSGTVVRHASDMGHDAFGFDMDPLAVLMTEVWTTPIDENEVLSLLKSIITNAKDLPSDVKIPWIDQDSETLNFTEFWFGKSQRNDLRRLSYVLQNSLIQSGLEGNLHVLNVLRLALSKIIITKKSGASLAWDVSHSRPHKVCNSSEYDVMLEFERAVKQICRILKTYPPRGGVNVQLGDARHLSIINDKSIDLVITSPPYLNAIDYMRGHKLSLVWLGYKLSSLRNIRANSIGAERSIDTLDESLALLQITQSMCAMQELTKRSQNMITRYAKDIYQMISEIARVLHQDGRAVLVVGNSCLKGKFIRNSDGVIAAARLSGMTLVLKHERDLPNTSRYLPIFDADNFNPLSRRMRTETVLQFSH